MQLLDCAGALVGVSMPKRLNASLTGSVLTAERSVPSTPRAEMTQLLDGAAFSAVFESSGEALIVLDSLGTVRRANRRSREMLRYHGSPRTAKEPGRPYIGSVGIKSALVV